jgi:two-component system, OmpR family, sensor kinase
MIKSLYIRVVLTFLISVIASTVLAFWVTFLMFEEKINDNLRTTISNFSQDIIRIYASLPLPEAEVFISEMKQLDSYYIRLYEDTTHYQTFGENNGEELFPITVEQIQKVLAGGVVQLDPTRSSTNLLGLPLRLETGTKALFVEPLIGGTAPFAIKWLSTFLIYSLVMGSLFILIAAIFLITPIKKLTKATRLVAGGDFNVKLNIKQTGELGTLARSFEDMMSDLEQLEQMRREFVSNVSHEVQSPLTSISGYAIALKQVDLTESERSRYLDIIIAEAKRMSKMSDSLLKLSVLESESGQMQRVMLSLDEQIRRVIVALQPQWSAREIRFELDLQPIRLWADYDQLNQVWTNILGNSIKFSPDQGVIDVSIQSDLNQVTVRIADQGIGISPEDQKRIFERFFKADRSHSRKYSGSGMGLAIVKQIVSLHEGTIRVESEPGNGTAFSVSLPLKAPTP